MITQQGLKQLLFYNSATGKFICIKARRKAKLYSTTGCIEPSGYVMIGIDYVVYRAHQLAWLYVYGVWLDEIDHIDTVKHHNWINNLRPASRSQSGMNKKIQKNNTSGYRGVYYNIVNRNYNARIQINKRTIHLGTFGTAYEASLVYEAYAVEHFGEFKFDSNKVISNV